MDPAPKFTPITPAIPTANSGPAKDKLDYWIKIIIGLCILVVAIDLSLIAFSKKNPFQKQTKEVVANAVTISGTYDINGYIPPDAIIEVQARQMGDSVFTTVAGPYGTADTSAWSWTMATDGATYEMKAVVMSNNAPVASSSILAVTAPALNETLRIVSSLTPPTATPATGSGTTPQNASAISGSVDLNGYIPSGSTITVSAQQQGSSQFTPVIQGLPASDGISWTWNQAQSGVTYQLMATLVLSNGTTIGTSPSLTTAAPAQNEVLVINSAAPAQSMTGSVSGKFNVNGQIPNGATITLAARKSGTPNFTPVQTGITPTDGTSWIYQGVQVGVSYDILAYLVVNNVNYTQSQLLVVTAPAHNEVLTINAASQPSAPPQTSITFNCPGVNNSNQWQVAIQYNQNNVNPGAQAFILQLGSTSGASDIFSIQTAPSNPSQAQTYTSNFILNQGQTYFAQYAYSTCQSCTNLTFYSQFSSPIPVRCVPQPTNTPSPTPSVTPQPTNSPTPTLSPTPTATNTPSPTPSPTLSPTPKISQCNESCGGSSGYQCATPLTCFDPSPGVIGGDVCRNPNCTDKTDCTCP